MKNESTLLNLSSDFTKFRVTLVKSYYDPANNGTSTNIDDQNISDVIDPLNATNLSDKIGHDLFKDATNRISENFSDNQPELIASIESNIRDQGKSRKHSNKVELISFNICFIFNVSELTDPTKSSENSENFNLLPYTASRQKEISGLLKKNI